MADRPGFAPASPAELTRWAGPHAGPPAPAVASDPTRDQPIGLSLPAASALAVRLLGPAAATATWTPLTADTAIAVIDGHQFAVIDETDPHGWFDSLGLYQLTACRVCGGEHQVPVRAAVRAVPARQGRTGPCPGFAGAPTRTGIPGRAPATNPPTRKEASPPSTPSPIANPPAVTPRARPSARSPRS